MTEPRDVDASIRDRVAWHRAHGALRVLVDLRFRTPASTPPRLGSPVQPNDDVPRLLDRLVAAEARVAALAAAARAVVEVNIIADVQGRHEYDYCMECERTLTTGHGGGCPIGALATLLGDAS